jgi:hypothetical protein
MVEVDGKTVSPKRRRNFFNRVAFVVGGVVDQRVHGTQLVRDISHKRGNSLQLREVGLDEKRLWPDFAQPPGQRMPGRRLNIDEGDARLLPHQMLDQRGADSGCASADQDRAIHKRGIKS